MNFDLDSGKVLYVLGVLFSLAAFAYFVQDVVFGLSITVKAALLFAAFVGFFVVGMAVERNALGVIAFVIAGISYAFFLGYVATRYELDETTIFLLLALSAGLFVGLGYGVRERDVALGTRTAGIVVVALLGVGLVLVGADVVGGGVTYTADLHESATASVPETVPADREHVPAEVHVGTVTATNEFVFTRPLDLPSARGCVLGTDAAVDTDVPVRYGPPRYERSDVIAGGTERTYDLEAQPILAANATETTFAVERGTDCDGSRSEPTLVIVFEDGLDRP